MNFLIPVEPKFNESEALVEYELVVEVVYFNDVEGNPNTWDSDLDYYGYTDIDWVVKGYVVWIDGEDKFFIPGEPDHEITLSDSDLQDKLIELVKEEIENDM